MERLLKIIEIYEEQVEDMESTISGLRYNVKDYRTTLDEKSKETQAQASLIIRLQGMVTDLKNQLAKLDDNSEVEGV